MKIKVKIEKLNKNIRIPEYANDGDSGLDIFLQDDVTILPYKTELIKTGFKVAIPKGYELQCRPKSGLSLKTTLRIPNSPGTVDSGYRDEVGVIVENIGSTRLIFKKGDKIAQLVLNEVPTVEWDIVDDITTVSGNRGGGFGSSGR